ncbi:hypothetical protein ABIA33_003030 [Streptacidiphilus sp. MAP12-16]
MRQRQDFGYVICATVTAGRPQTSYWNSHRQQIPPRRNRISLLLRSPV